MCAVVLAIGFAFKAQCTSPVGWDGRQYERLCYNDIQALYGARGIDQNVFPYTSGGLIGGDLGPGVLEYPVLTGVFMWATGLPVNDFNQYLRVSALALAPFGLLVAYLLARMTAWRALMWAAAPALILYAFHNWDLLAVAAATGGFYAWHRGRLGWAGVLFGVGAAFKLYPVLFLAPLLLDALARGDRRGAAVGAGAGVGTLALVNLPFVLIDSEGWWAPFQFHRARGPNWDNVWTWRGPDFVTPEQAALSPGEINLISFVLVGLFGLAALGYGWRRAGREGTFPFVAVCGALLVAFLAFNKVHSPQYALWLLPFFSLLSVNIAWWAGYALVDLVVYVGVFRWFYDFVYQQTDLTTAKRAMVLGVWARGLLLVVLFVVFLRARASIKRGEEGESEVVSHPPARVGVQGDQLPAQG